MVGLAVPSQPWGRDGGTGGRMLGLSGGLCGVAVDVGSTHILLFTGCNEASRGGSWDAWGRGCHARAPANERGHTWSIRCARWSGAPGSRAAR